MRLEDFADHPSGGRGRPPSGGGPVSIADELAKKQREISVSEFFERNKHILGFDNPTRALITAVKEGVDNALDACEESGVLPDILVEIKKLAEDDYLVAIQDNGPGIVKRQVPNVFARLLYGSRFHAIRQSRGQQGIGISAVVMYGQLTTGKPAVVTTRIGPDHPAYRIEVMLDTKKNAPSVVSDKIVEWDETNGTRVEIEMEARYQRGSQSIYEYMRTTSIVNPHAQLTLVEPDGTRTLFPRASEKVPEPTVEIKPHPLGIELGQLMAMAKNTEATKLTSFLTNDFTRVGLTTARQICKAAGLDEGSKPKKIGSGEAKALMKAFKATRIVAPPTDCLSPIGETLIRRGLRTEYEDAQFIETSTRPAAVYGGHPFQVEAAVVFGGSKLKADETATILRFANRVPLLYQRGACVSTTAVESIDWRRYDLEQRGGKGIPVGPVAILVHVASTNVPFTSESKDAIAAIPEIENEVKLALRECGRKMRAHIRKRRKLSRMKEKETLIRKIVPAIAEKSATILGRDVPDYERTIARIMNAVMVTPAISYESGVGHTINVKVTNYTTAGKSLRVLVEGPPEGEIEEPTEKMKLEGRMLTWKVSRLQSGESKVLSFRVRGLEAADIEDVDVFIDGIDAALIAGAEEWTDTGARDVAPAPIEERGDDAEELEDDLEDELDALEEEAEEVEV